MTKYYTIACLFLLSCNTYTSVSYLGNSYKPTKKVDVYVDASAIKKPYTVVGKGYTGSLAYNPLYAERMQENAIEKAKEKGADAVLFLEEFVFYDGTSHSNYAKTDSTGTSLVSVNNTPLNPMVSTRREILFLKYN